MPRDASTVVVGEGVWPAIRHALRGRRAPIAAVAYVTASDLPLKPGSILVCDAEEQTVRQGKTNPRVLGPMLKDGVRVFSMPGLHAKMLAGQDAAVVGSANLSNSSAERLIEAVAILPGSRHASAVRRQIELLISEARELDPVEVKRLIGIYRPPPPSSSSPTRRSTLWRVATWREDWTDEEVAAAERGEPLAMQALRREFRGATAHAWRLDQVSLLKRMVANGLDRGMEVVECLHRGRSIMVQPIAKLLHVEPTTKGRWAIAFLARRRKAEARSLTSIKHKLTPALRRSFAASSPGSRLTVTQARIARSALGRAESSR
jgi:hypothetical protein